MPTGRKSPIPAHINTHPKAPFCLIFSNLLPSSNEIPHIYPPIIRSARQELSILAQRNGPYLSRLVAVLNLAFSCPFSRFRNAPYLHLAAETCAGCYSSVAGGYDVMAAELVCAGKGLRERDVGGGGGVYFD